LKASILIIVLLLVLPFLVYLFSKIQMVAWLKAIEEEMHLVPVKIKSKKKEEVVNGKEEKRVQG